MNLYCHTCGAPAKETKRKREYDNHTGELEGWFVYYQSQLRRKIE